MQINYYRWMFGTYSQFGLNSNCLCNKNWTILYFIILINNRVNFAVDLALWLKFVEKIFKSNQCIFIILNYRHFSLKWVWPFISIMQNHLYYLRMLGFFCIFFTNWCVISKCDLVMLGTASFPFAGNVCFNLCSHDCHVGGDEADIGQSLLHNYCC